MSKLQIILSSLVKLGLILSPLIFNDLILSGFISLWTNHLSLKYNGVDFSSSSSKYAPIIPAEQAGQAFLSLGTSGVYFVVSEHHHANLELTVHAFCHCLPQRWHQMSVALSAANSIAWFANLM